MAKRNENWVAGSFHNVTITATVNEIISVLGEPSYAGNTGDDNTNFDWNGITNDGIEFTVYDWKEGRPIDLNESIRFHIGGTGGMLDDVEAEEELLKDIQRIKAEALVIENKLKSELGEDVYNALRELKEIDDE